MWLILTDANTGKPRRLNMVVFHEIEQRKYCTALLAPDPQGGGALVKETVEEIDVMLARFGALAVKPRVPTDQQKQEVLDRLAARDGLAPEPAIVTARIEGDAEMRARNQFEQHPMLGAYVIRDEEGRFLHNTEWRFSEASVFDADEVGGVVRKQKRKCEQVRIR